MGGSAMNYVLVGKSVVIARKIHQVSPQSNLLIVDEQSNLSEISMPAEIQAAHYGEIAYQNEPQIDQLVAQLNGRSVDAIILAFERTVTLANQLAAAMQRPRIGDLGAKLFRNKLALRSFCQDLPINQPAYQQVTSIEQLRTFFKAHGAMILKPTTLAGSLGVVKITDEAQLASEFAFCQQIAEDADEPVALMAEEMITGAEYSCEYVVQSGHVIFQNLTKKFKFHNEFFVESGHLVPAIVNGQLRQAIYQMMDCLVNAAEIDTAVLHAEWLVTADNQPYLVECAGRRPGDRIVDLITAAYGDDFLWKYCQLLAGQPVSFNATTRNFASQTYFDAQPGVIVNIEHEAALDPCPHQLAVSVGDSVPVFSDSEKRLGYVIISDPDFFHLEDLRHELLATFKIVTEKKAD